MRQYWNPDNRNYLLRYVGISLYGYAFVFLGMYVLVDLLALDEQLSFLIIYAALYVQLYYLQLVVLNRKQHNRTRLLRYVLSIGLFYLVGQLLFALFTHWQLQYLWATAATLIIMFPIKFLATRYVIYR